MLRNQQLNKNLAGLRLEEHKNKRGVLGRIDRSQEAVDMSVVYLISDELSYFKI